MKRSERAHAVYDILKEHYELTATFLDWERPWELFVATVLSAQCTDERVNMVTPNIFARWPDAATLATAKQAELEEVIRSTGFFRNKAKNLIAAAQMVTTEYGGELPRTMAEMTRLPGAARKTANIVLTYGLGIVEGIAVDTHVKRIAYRLGLTTKTAPDQVERDLTRAFDKEIWPAVNHMLVAHGKAVCVARTPRCSACQIAHLCPQKGVTKKA